MVSLSFRLDNHDDYFLASYTFSSCDIKYVAKSTYFSLYPFEEFKIAFNRFLELVCEYLIISPDSETFKSCISDLYKCFFKGVPFDTFIGEFYDLEELYEHFY